MVYGKRVFVFFIGGFAMARMGEGYCPSMQELEGYAATLFIDFEHFDHDLLLDMDNLSGILDEMVGHMGDMDQAFHLDSHIDEAAELGDVGHYAGDFHSFTKVIERVEMFVETEHLGCAARVTAGTCEFQHDVSERGEAHFGGAIAMEVDLVALVGRGDEFGHIAAGFLGHALHEGIALRMDCGVVEGVLGIGDAEESCTLLEGFGTQTGHLEQFAARTEGAVGGTIVDDILRQSGSESGDVGEEMLGGRVEVHTDGVDAAFDGEVKCLTEFGLVDIVLVLPHPDGLGVDFDEFGQGVGQTATDADGSAHRDIIVGEFLTGQFGGGIDGGAVLTDEEYIDILEMERTDELFRFAACRTVADGDGLDMVLLNEGGEFETRTGILILGRMGIDGLVVEQIALTVETHDFTSRTETGVDAHDALLTQGSGEEQLLEIAGKDLNGFFIGLRLAASGKFGLDAGFEQTFIGIGCGHFDLGGCRGAPTHVFALDAFQAVFLIGGGDADAQQAFGFPATHGEEAMGGAAAEGFLPVEIVAEFTGFGFLGLDDFGLDHGGDVEGTAHGLTRLFVLIDAFGKDVTRSLQGFFDIGHVLAHEARSEFRGVGLGIHKELVRQGFESFLTGHFGSRAAFGLEGEIDILKERGVPAVADALAEVVGEFALLFNGGEDVFAAMDKLLHAVVFLLDLRHLHFIEPAGGFLAVTADEGDSGSCREEIYGAGHLLEAQTEFFGYDFVGFHNGVGE